MVDDELWAGRYRRDRLLGRGAMGEVWAAHDVVLDRQVAIKSIASARADANDLDRMAREARVAARIGHPNAVGVYDLLTVDGRSNLVMEFVEGTTLDELIRSRGRLEPQEVSGIGAAVADALAEAHRLGVVHRDIKPANILITPRGVPKLADFGIARAAGDVHLTADGATIGTPAYLAPEIVLGAVADARSDIWSLGVTLYAALVGSSPFVLSPEDEAMIVLGRAVNMPIRFPEGGGAPAEDVMAMLDRDPARRPTAAAVAARLRADHRAVAAEDTHDLSPARPTVQLRPDAKRRWRSVLIPLVVVVVLAVAGAAAYVLTRSGSGSSTPRSTGQRYRGPSDIVTTGPKGWHRDTSYQSVLETDYLSPSTADHHIGDYFRLGVFSRHSKSDIEKTAADEDASVRTMSESGLTHPVIVAKTYVDFLGTRAVDVEWTGVNPEHVQRHALVRLWNADGVTREISVNTTAATWPGARKVFDQLVSNCRIDR